MVQDAGTKRYRSDSDSDLDNTSKKQHHIISNNIVYDDIRYTDACDGTKHVLTPLCSPITLEDVGKKRPPLVVKVGDLIAEGGYNTVEFASVCDRCTTEHKLAVRHGLHALEESEIVMAITMGQMNIGPRIYGFDRRRLIMEAYDTNLQTFLDSHSNTSNIRDMVRMLRDIINRVAALGYLLVDIKPLNIVLNDQATVTEMRLIDFDPQFTIRLGSEKAENPVVQRVYAFLMIYFVFLFNFELGTKHTERAKQWMREMSTVVSAMFKELQETPTAPELFDELFDDYLYRMCKHYFPHMYWWDMGDVSEFRAIPYLLIRSKNITDITDPFPYVIQ